LRSVDKVDMAAEFKFSNTVTFRRLRSHIQQTRGDRGPSNTMNSDFDNRDGPIAGPSRVETNSYQSSSLLQIPPAVTYPNLGDTGTKVTPQKLRRASNGIIDCDQ
jgi:hypothetical protein